jgi:hypothetical protein
LRQFDFSSAGLTPLDPVLQNSNPGNNSSMKISLSSRSTSFKVLYGIG